jgi:hemin uptake protein HemP
MDAARRVDDDRMPPAARRVSSMALFGDERELVIVHHGQVYRLRITKADKLILTK